MDSPSTVRIREGLSTVTRGTLFLLVATLLFVLFNFIARVIIVRSISPDEWSAFSWSLTLAGFLAAFGTLGLPNAIARSLPFASSDSERRSMVRGTLLLGAAAGGVLAVTLYIAGPWIGARLGQPDIGVALLFLAVAVASLIVSNLIASVFQGYEDVTPNALLLQILTPLLFVIFLFVALVQPGGVTFREALLAYAASSALGLGLAIGYLAFRLPRRLPAGPGAPRAFPTLLVFAGPLFVASILSSLTGNGDTLVLGLFFPTAVGTYSASLTLARLLQVGIGAAGYIFLPVTTRLFRSGDTDSIRVTYATVTKWMVLFSLPLFVLFFFLPSRSLGFVYGSNYTGIIAPLQITVVGAFASTLFGPGSATQVALGQTRLVAINSAAAAVVDVGLSFWLVPHYGPVGSALAWASAAVLASGLSLVELAFLSGIHPFRAHSLVPLALTGVPFGLLLGILHPALPYWTLPVLGLGVAGLFILIVIATRSVDRGDRLLLDVVERLLGRPLPLVRRVGRLFFRDGGPPT
ncbi:MAG: oligosaccharide flippase family protein [Thermoplasmata archaeon]|nr:oligosaccharide flippase family protein [Thermoplasmata archaeon]